MKRQHQGTIETMTLLYDIVFVIFAIVYLPTLILKGKFHRDFFQRFGIFGDGLRGRISESDSSIWIHAVSVGEVRAVKPLVDALRRESPERGIVITTTTWTGNALARELFALTAVVLYAPLDVSVITERFVETIRPDLVALMETELWPNLIISLSKRRIPVVVLNGRVSDSSLAGYRLIKPFMLPVLNVIDRYCMQTERDAERVTAIGAPVERVVVTGNMKFEIGQASGNAQDPEAVTHQMRRRFHIDADDEVLIGGSTHSGEEAILLTAYERLAKENPRLRLVLAPRHVERSDEIERLITSRGFRTVRVSRLSEGAATDGRPVFVLDTIGQLKDVYALATLVFIGGSLVRKGGHNLVEPAVLGKPIVCGAEMHNFRDMVNQFVEKDAVVVVHDTAALEKTLRALLADRHKRDSLGENAKRLVYANRGAVRRTIDVIHEALEVRQTVRFRTVISHRRSISGYIHDVMLGRSYGPFAACVRLLLRIASFGYAVLIVFWKFLFESHIAKTRSVNSVVISVGNITLGGTGKTPFVIMLAALIKERFGKDTLILTRGYGDDEHLMLRERLSGCQVVTGRDRAANALAAAARFGDATFILDDGFQHRALGRSFDIVLIDGGTPFGNGWLFPAGILREPLSSLKRASCVVITKADVPGVEKERIMKTLMDITSGVLCVEAVHKPTEWIEVGTHRTRSLGALTGERAVVVSAIGDPGYFELTVRRLSVTVTRHLVYADHYAYRQGDIGRILDVCAERRASIVVMTEKDAVKIRRFIASREGAVTWYALRAEMDLITMKEHFVDRLHGLYTRHTAQ